MQSICFVRRQCRDLSDPSTCVLYWNDVTHRLLTWQGVEATLFATLMSILNGGSFAGSAFGSGLTAAFGVTATNFTLLAPLVAVSMLLCCPLPL